MVVVLFSQLMGEFSSVDSALQDSVAAALKSLPEDDNTSEDAIHKRCSGDPDIEVHTCISL